MEGKGEKEVEEEAVVIQRDDTALQINDQVFDNDESVQDGVRGGKERSNRESVVFLA